MDFLRTGLMVLGGVMLLWLGSCTLLGVGAAVAVNSVAGDGVAKIDDRAREYELKAHNEMLNREAVYNSYPTASSYNDPTEFDHPEY